MRNDPLGEVSVDENCPAKADPDDFPGRFREIISDPLNLLIKRVPQAGIVTDGYVTFHNGNNVRISGPGAYYGEFSDVLALNRGVHEPLEEYCFQEMLATIGEAPVMLELGAYWAHYSMWLKQVRPKATVIMVEPDDINIQAGIGNFEHNGMLGEFIHDFVMPGRFEVDQFMQARHLPRLDILHSDIQGAELSMLDGAQRALGEGLIDRLFISTHSQDGHFGIANALLGYGYRIDVSSDFDNETTSYDGLIVASKTSLPSALEGFRPLGRRQIAASSPEALAHGVATRFRCGAVASGQ